MADMLAWLFIIFVGGGLALGLIGLLLPLVIFAIGFGPAILAFYVLAWFLGRIFS